MSKSKGKMSIDGDPPSRRKSRTYTSEEEQAVIQAVAEHAGPGRYSGARAVARKTGMPYSNVQSVIDRNLPAVEILRKYNLEHHIALLQDRSIMCAERAGIPTLKSNEVRDYAIASGIFQDKFQLLLNRPTEITAHLHAHRHEIHDLGKKLAIALEMMDRARGKEKQDPEPVKQEEPS